MDPLVFQSFSVDPDEQLQLQEDRPSEQLVRELHSLLREKIKQLQAFEVLSESYQRDLAQQDLVIREQSCQLARQSEQLLLLKADNNKIRLELEQLKSYLNFCRVKYESLAQQVAPPTAQFRSESRMKGFFKQNRQYNQSRKSIETCESSEYIIEKIKLKKQTRSSNERLQEEVRRTDEPTLISAGECLGQDFFVVGPDVNDISIEKMKDRSVKELHLKPTFLYQLNREVRPERCDKRRDILLRSFPNNVTVRKLDSGEYGLAVRQMIEYLPSYNLHPDYFIFTLRGEADMKADLTLPVLEECNLNKTIFVLCLKLMDVVAVKSTSNSSKHAPVEYWLTEKVYVIMSYYPLFDCHVRLLVELQRMNVLTKLRCLQVDPGKIVSFCNMDMRDFTRSEAAGEFLRSYLHQKPNGSMDWVKIGQDNFATMPQKRDLKYLMAGYASGYVFANICYEEFLVILTAILCEKTLVFVSRSASLASFTALTFLGLIAPFRYPHPQVLNADQQKIKDIIFQSPMPLLVSITTDKLDFVLEQFLQANIENQRSPFILVDLDSSSILLDKNVRNQLLRIIPMPTQELKARYQSHNKCRPRSVPLIRSMQAVSGVLTTGGKKHSHSRSNEREQRRRQLERQYKQQLDLNESPRLHSIQPDYQLVRLIYQFVQNFSVKEVLRRIHRRQQLKQQVQRIKRKLFDENYQYRPFLDTFVQTQIFNSHLDSKLEYG